MNLNKFYTISEGFDFQGISDDYNEYQDKLERNNGLDTNIDKNTFGVNILLDDFDQINEFLIKCLSDNNDVFQPETVQLGTSVMQCGTKYKTDYYYELCKKIGKYQLFKYENHTCLFIKLNPIIKVKYNDSIPEYYLKLGRVIIYNEFTENGVVGPNPNGAVGPRLTISFVNTNLSKKFINFLNKFCDQLKTVDENTQYYDVKTEELTPYNLILFVKYLKQYIIDTLNI